MREVAICKEAKRRVFNGCGRGNGELAHVVPTDSYRLSTSNRQRLTHTFRADMYIFPDFFP